MSQISPPIRIVLVCAVAVLAAWMLFLRPQAEPVAAPPATTPATSTAAAGGEVAQSTAANAVTTPPKAAKAKAKAKAAGLPQPVKAALADRKVVVLLFWSPRAADDRLVREELAGVDRHGRKVVVHAAPMKRFARYQGITRGATVEQSPTVVVVDRDRKVETLVGYVDRVSIDQAVTDALRNS
jgi:hypothetical protein